MAQKLIFNEDIFEGIFNEWIENNLSNEKRNDDCGMANLFELTMDFIRKYNPRSRMEIENQLEKNSNVILGTTF